jgi:DMSO reductase family type II enzyme heme b subunit
LPSKLPEGLEKPYFGHGDGGHPVNIWRWKSGTADQPEKISLLDMKGIGKVEPREGGTQIAGKGVYDKGHWRVVMKRSLQTGDKEKDLQIEPGKFMPIAFATWDGSNGETGSKHELTTWYWVFLKPPSGSNVFVTPVVVMLLVFGGELLLAKQVGKK